MSAPFQNLTEFQKIHSVLAQVVILAMPCHENDAAAKHIDPTGLACMAVLRSLGLPTLVAVATVGAPASLKDRAQAKKTVAAALSVEVRDCLFNVEQSCALGAESCSGNVWCLC